MVSTRRSLRSRNALTVLPSRSCGMAFFLSLSLFFFLSFSRQRLCSSVPLYDATPPRRYARSNDAALWLDQNNHISIDGITRLHHAAFSRDAHNRFCVSLSLSSHSPLTFSSLSLRSSCLTQRFTHPLTHALQSSARARTAAASASSSSKSSRR